MAIDFPAFTGEPLQLKLFSDSDSALLAASLGFVPGSDNFFVLELSASFNRLYFDRWYVNAMASAFLQNMQAVLLGGESESGPCNGSEMRAGEECDVNDSLAAGAANIAKRLPALDVIALSGESLVVAGYARVGKVQPTGYTCPRWAAPLEFPVLVGDQVRLFVECNPEPVDEAIRFCAAKGVVLGGKNLIALEMCAQSNRLRCSRWFAGEMAKAFVDNLKAVLDNRNKEEAESGKASRGEW
ncbi:MAG: hypothetical protein N2652_11735 [Kiritimatiellae bacterium]|nr:hypothetical protein [Kiritimatiellia bacterium]